MNKESKTDLLAEFPSASYEDWHHAAEELLKGAPFDKKMLTTTIEGITLQPIYRRESLASSTAAATVPGFDGNTRGAYPEGYRLAPWEIAQELPYGEPVEFNRAAMQDLAHGQNALNVTFDIATMMGLDPDSAQDGEVGACGLSLASLSDMKTAFANVIPEAISFYFQSGCVGMPVFAIFRAWLEGQTDLKLNEINGGLGVDPLSVLASSGTLPTSLTQLYDEMASIARNVLTTMPHFSAVGVSSLTYHCAGANATQELAALLATGLEYLRELTKRGIDINYAARQMRFNVSIGADFFMELAKIRAARQLWATIIKELGGNAEAQAMRLHARTGLNNKTRHDPYANMLRTATEALCGVISGVESLTVGTFDEVIREPDDFSRRIARNTQVILQEECELTAVIDPAGGSWYVENLTEQVARESWKLFQKIEAAGGMAQALQNKVVQLDITKTAEQKQKLVGQRRISLVGTNQYPNLSETILDVRHQDYKALRLKRANELAQHRMSGDDETDRLILKQLAEIQQASSIDVMPKLILAAASGATLGEMTRALRVDAGPAPKIELLPNRRLAAIYEELRAAASQYEKKHGHGPLLFLANLGPLRRHKARADFTLSFFETGGFQIICPDGFTDPQEAATAMAASGAQIAVVCGTDDDYATQAPNVIRAIKEQLPKASVILAGFPGEQEAAYRKAGLDDYIFIKSDNYATNRKYLEFLNVI